MKYSIGIVVVVFNVFFLLICILIEQLQLQSSILDN